MLKKTLIELSSNIVLSFVNDCRFNQDCTRSTKTFQVVLPTRAYISLSLSQCSSHVTTRVDKPYDPKISHFLSVSIPYDVKISCFVL